MDLYRMLKSGDGVSDCLLSAGLNMPGERCWITTAGFLLYSLWPADTEGATPPLARALRCRYIRGLATGSGDELTVMVTVVAAAAEGELRLLSVSFSPIAGQLATSLL